MATASLKRLYVENRPYIVSGYCQNRVANNTCSESVQLVGLSDSTQQEAFGNVSSMVEKYASMKATFRKRLTFGESSFFILLYLHSILFIPWSSLNTILWEIHLEPSVCNIIFLCDLSYFVCFLHLLPVLTGEACVFPKILVFGEEASCPISHIAFLHHLSFINICASSFVMFC